MGWITLLCRKSELINSISAHSYEKLKLSNELKKLTSFSSAIADGFVSPEEVTSLGGQLFGDALDFNVGAWNAVSQRSQDQTDLYEKMYGDITEEQYYNNPDFMAKVGLYYDENGNFDTETLYNKFCEENLIEFAEEYYMPLLKEKQDELEQQKLELETLTEQEEAELQQLTEKISQEISSNVIRL